MRPKALATLLPTEVLPTPVGRPDLARSSTRFLRAAGPFLRDTQRKNEYNLHHPCYQHQDDDCLTIPTSLDATPTYSGRLLILLCFMLQPAQCFSHVDILTDQTCIGSARELRTWPLAHDLALGRVLWGAREDISEIAQKPVQASQAWIQMSTTYSIRLSSAGHWCRLPAKLLNIHTDSGAARKFLIMPWPARP